MAAVSHHALVSATDDAVHNIVVDDNRQQRAADAQLHGAPLLPLRRLVPASRQDPEEHPHQGGEQVWRWVSAGYAPDSQSYTYIDRKLVSRSGWLVPFTSPSTRDLTTQLFHSSVVQNEILFSSDGLTLLTLDRLYSIKSALSSYSKTTSALRLEDAVDELRRYVLANNGRKVTRSDLLRSYDWLSVSNSAITDLDRMYRRAYGGPELMGGIAGMPLGRPIKPFVLQLPPKSRFDDWEDGSLSPSSTILDEGIVNVAMTAVKFARPPTPRKIGPSLKLQTDFSPKPKPESPDQAGKAAKGGDSDDQCHTARPVDRSAASMWNSRFTIDQMLSPAANQGLQVHSPAIGPMTPHAYDDISPVTRGEWGFLMGGNGLKIGKTAAVETF